METLQGMAKVGYWSFDIATQKPTWSKQISLNLAELTVPEEREQAKADFMKLQKSGRLRREYRFVKKGGSSFYMTLDATKLSDDRYLGFCKDTTDRRMVEELADHQLLLENREDNP